MAVNERFWLGTSWKMNKTLAEARTWVAAALPDRSARPVLQEFVIPAFTAIATVAELLRDSTVLVGAQDVHPDPDGPHTGDVSARLAADAGAVLAEIGHQERRRDHGEDDALVNRKVLAAASAGMRPLLCVGDTALDRVWDTPAETLARQLKAGLANLDPELRSTVVIAYEPAWAIGIDGVPATTEQIHLAHRTIRRTLATMWGAGTASTVPLLYGGSVARANAALIAGVDEVDGLFIGRAALDPVTYTRIRADILSTLRY